ncbi:hypothetical protein DPMN_016126 [Dreissena polymorpha]|uniref:Uncharacterized protein n=1 Tax=Dreissena polymorpha TaxID=45954 RepID=A0A9D4NCR8_DREPO|nr:hypothetical protein DPMN_016126 [Dreissena polymorpha]
MQRPLQLPPSNRPKNNPRPEPIGQQRSIFTNCREEEVRSLKEGKCQRQRLFDLIQNGEDATSVAITELCRKI